MSTIGVGAAAVLLVLAVVGAVVVPRLIADPTGQQAAPPATSGEPSTMVSPPRTSGPPTTPPRTTSPPTKTPTKTRPPADNSPPLGSPMPSFEDTVLRMVNEERAKRRNCSALRNDADLHEAARAHSMDMARYRYHSHTGRNGSDPGQRMRAAGYDVSGGWAENIARGYATPAAVMAGWMKSPDHRANILNCDLKAIGVGAARATNGELFWTQDFGGR